jgi:hypothetical protein
MISALRSPQSLTSTLTFSISRLRPGAPMLVTATVRHYAVRERFPLIGGHQILHLEPKAQHFEPNSVSVEWSLH